MRSPIPGDEYFLLITLIVTVVYQLSFFVVAFSCKFDKVTDFAGGSNFVVLAILTLILGGNYYVRQIAVTAAVCLWGVRISAFLLYRVIKMGKDDRFDGAREKFFLFLGFWLFQMIWAWCGCLPITFLNATNVNPRFHPGDFAGLIMFVIGFFFEFVGDIQKDIFKSRGGRGICDTGLWYYTRHPNYFGDLLQWWGIFTACSTVFGPASDEDDPSWGNASYKNEASWGYATICGPIFITIIILFASGIPTVEASWDKKYGESAAYWDYKERTSILFPMPPGLFKRLPKFVKVLVFCEWPMYTGAQNTRRNSETRPLGSPLMTSSS